MKTKTLSFLRFCFCLFLFTNLQAQEDDLGKYETRPWVKIVNYTGPIFSKGYNNRFRGMKFGDWTFVSYPPDPEVHITDANAFPQAKYLNYIHPDRCNDKHVEWTHIDSIEVDATAPGGKKFHSLFSYTDSFYEQDYHQSFIDDLANYENKNHRKNYFAFIYWKKLEGTVNTSSGEIFPFFISLHYDDAYKQPFCYIMTGPDTITLKPIFNPDMGKAKRGLSSVSNYEGFEFYNGDYYLGNVVWFRGFGARHYTFWFDHDLDEKHQEAATAMIFIIAAFIH